MFDCYKDEEKRKQMKSKVFSQLKLDTFLLQLQLQLHYDCGKILLFRLVRQQSEIKADFSVESRISFFLIWAMKDP